jgi:hypothetical protein
MRDAFNELTTALGLCVSAPLRFRFTGSNLFPLENQFPILHADFDFIARLEFTRQQLCCERVEQVFLNRALEQARIFI